MDYDTYILKITLQGQNYFFGLYHPEIKSISYSSALLPEKLFYSSLKSSLEMLKRDKKVKTIQIDSNPNIDKGSEKKIGMRKLKKLKKELSEKVKDLEFVI